ncbi:MAG TPA: hypothetical protein VFX35_11250 [Solirubrobacterales bacterium]|nr:hypothetical protein [Solirubrobacterales bacterium]
MSITDLFVLGLGLDLAGAAILARGLLLGSASIADLGTWRGLSHGMTVERCSDRAHAELGLAALGLGFLLQAAGYATVIGGVKQASGMREAAVAILLLFVAGASVVWLWRRTHGPRLRSLLVSVALHIGASEAELEDAAPSPWTNSRVMYLVGLARAAGWHPEPSDQFDSGAHLFVDRVFGIEVPRYLPMPEVRE